MSKKKQGIKKGSAQTMSYAARLAYSAEAHDMRQREFGRQFGDDMWTLALGRVGWREKRMGDIKKHLEDVNNEFCTAVLLDAEGDKDIWYSKEALDREIKRYVGKLFVPYDERYAERKPKEYPMTNVRNLRTIPIDELAHFLATWEPKSEEEVLNWLKEKVEEEET